MSLKTPLLSATARILRPLVRMLVRHGIPYQSFSELARWTYVDVVRREFEIPGRKQTRSRISVLTGLSRKEVQRLIDQPTPTDDVAADRHHRAARIVSAWVRDPAYLDAGGEPRPLPFDGSEPSFSRLVADLGGDVPPKAVLDELARVGTVRHDPEGRVVLGSRAYLPTGPGSGEERYAILGHDVAALLDTIDHNLGAPPGDRFFQRKVAYRGVPAETIPEIRAHAGVEGQRLLEALDRALDRKVQPSAAGGGEAEGPTRRVVFGMYWFHEDEGVSHPDGGKKS